MDTITDLDTAITNKLQYYLNCNDLPNVCALVKSPTGYQRVFDRTKDLILNEGVKDVDAALVMIEASNDHPSPEADARFIVYLNMPGDEKDQMMRTGDAAAARQQHQAWTEQHQSREDVQVIFIDRQQQQQPTFETGGNVGEKIFLWKDKTGRGERPHRMNAQHILDTWEEELDEEDDNDIVLRDFVTDCDIGDVWETRTQSLECIEMKREGGTTAPPTTVEMDEDTDDFIWDSQGARFGVTHAGVFKGFEADYESALKKLNFERSLSKLYPTLWRVNDRGHYWAVDEQGLEIPGTAHFKEGGMPQPPKFTQASYDWAEDTRRYEKRAPELFSLVKMDKDTSLVIDTGLTEQDFRKLQTTIPGARFVKDTTLIGYHISNPEGDAWMLVPSFHLKGEKYEWADGGMFPVFAMPEVPTLIYRQLTEGGKNRMRVFSWGAHNWVGDQDSLTFNVQGHHFTGKVRIYYSRQYDTYGIQFIRDGKVVEELEPNGVAFMGDDLNPTIDEHVEKISDYEYARGGKFPNIISFLSPKEKAAAEEALGAYPMIGEWMEGFAKKPGPVKKLYVEFLNAREKMEHENPSALQLMGYEPDTIDSPSFGKHTFFKTPKANLMYADTFQILYNKHHTGYDAEKQRYFSGITKFGGGGGFGTWQVYYMDNDGRKQVVADHLQYHHAVSIAQRKNSAEPWNSYDWEAMAEGGPLQKPVFKFYWQKLEPGDYTDLKSFKAAYREWEAKVKAQGEQALQLLQPSVKAAEQSQRIQKLKMAIGGWVGASGITRNMDEKGLHFSFIPSNEGFLGIDGRTVKVGDRIKKGSYNYTLVKFIEDNPYHGKLTKFGWRGEGGGYLTDVHGTPYGGTIDFAKSVYDRALAYGTLERPTMAAGGSTGNVYLDWKLPGNYYYDPFYSTPDKTAVLNKVTGKTIPVAPTKRNIDLLQFGHAEGYAQLQQTRVVHNAGWRMQRGYSLIDFPYKPRSKEQAHEYFSIIKMGATPK